MGYYIYSYAIDTDKIRKSIGSGNYQLYEEILRNRDLSYLDFKGYITTQEALLDLIFGKKYNVKSAHAYWYALIAMCHCLGEELPATHEINMGDETDLINRCLLSDFGVSMKIEKELFEGKTPDFGLPPVLDWPECGLLSKTALTLLQEKFKSIEITNEMLDKLAAEDDEKEMAYDSIKQTIDNISYCLQHNLDMISFCH